MSKVQLSISDDSRLELDNLNTGAFHPLQGFMNHKDYTSVVNNLRLTNGMPWSLPVTLEVPETLLEKIKKVDEVELLSTTGTTCGQLQVEDVFQINPNQDIKQIYGTEDPAHPGVAKELSRSPYRVGGKVEALNFMSPPFAQYAQTPTQTKQLFKEKGWQTVVGFQTRNPIHRAHEYLQRTALELVDGLFIQPLIGWKKEGDFTPEAVIKAYEVQVDQFYPTSRVVLDTLRTAMRYAGPREAIFHALIRKNYGCTHFIVGRDHAGVGGYYGKYEAQDLCLSIKDLGITILPLCGPYYCHKCGTITTEKTCKHGDDFTHSISGTEVRAHFREKKHLPQEFMRKEIMEALLELADQENLFCS